MEDSTTDTLRERVTDDLAQALLDSMRKSIEPITTELERLDAEIDKRETELKELRKLRTSGRHIASSLQTALDPESAKAKAKAKANGPALSPNRLSADGLRRLEDWLRTTYKPEEVFYVKQAVEDGSPLSRASMTAGFRQLRDAGAVRLDHVSKGGRQNYKLIG